MFVDFTSDEFAAKALDFLRRHRYAEQGMLAEFDRVFSHLSLSLSLVSHSLHFLRSLMFMVVLVVDVALPLAVATVADALCLLLTMDITACLMAGILPIRT